MQVFFKKREYFAFYIKDDERFHLTFIGPNPRGVEEVMREFVAERVFEQAGFDVKLSSIHSGRHTVQAGLPTGSITYTLPFYADELGSYLHVLGMDWKFEGQIFSIDHSKIEEKRERLGALKFKN